MLNKPVSTRRMDYKRQDAINGCKLPDGVIKLPVEGGVRGTGPLQDANSSPFSPFGRFNAKPCWASKACCYVLTTNAERGGMHVNKSPGAPLLPNGN